VLVNDDNCESEVKEEEKGVKKRMRNESGKEGRTGDSVGRNEKKRRERGSESERGRCERMKGESVRARGRGVLPWMNSGM
jgi:hypothetical protein